MQGKHARPAAAPYNASRMRMPSFEDANSASPTAERAHCCAVGSCLLHGRQSCPRQPLHQPPGTAAWHASSHLGGASLAGWSAHEHAILGRQPQVQLPKGVLQLGLVSAREDDDSGGGVSAQPLHALVHHGVDARPRLSGKQEQSELHITSGSCCMQLSTIQCRQPDITIGHYANDTGCKRCRAWVFTTLAECEGGCKAAKVLPQRSITGGFMIDCIRMDVKTC